jgi:UDP-3-O-[3-hydroxymyristoyl] glucosamine N-acyltransferase
MISDARTLQILAWPTDAEHWHVDPDTGRRCWVHPTARIASTAILGDQTLIHAGATIAGHVTLGPRCTIAAHARIGAHSTLTADVAIGENTRLGPRCTLGEHTSIGAHSTIAADVTIGPHSTIAERVSIGRGASIGYGCKLGHKAIVHAGGVLPERFELPELYIYRTDLYMMTERGRVQISGARPKYNLRRLAKVI